MALQSSTKGKSKSDTKSLLCETCANLDWEHILKGTLSDDARQTFSMRHAYNLDGMDKTGAAFLRGSTASIATIATTSTTCPLCRLWLRGYRRAYPDLDPAKDARGVKSSWFTYYVGSSNYGSEWNGNPRGIDDDVQSSASRKKAMKAFRMRFRSYEDSRNFVRDLELTCLDEDLPPESRSRGGRLLQGNSCRSGLYKDWLGLCRASHGADCESMLSAEVIQNLSSTVKLRLIDVHELKVVVGDFHSRYCALSYVWGAIKSFRSTASSCVADATRPGEVFLDLKPFVTRDYGGTAEYSPESPANLVPRTILDAIEVTKELGEQYLWVDSICILQELEELAAATGHMDIIYKKALLTIVAASGIHCDSGLPRSHERAPRIEQIREQVGNRTFLLAQPSLDLVLEESKWMSRGWTFQEMKLSLRLLIFTDKGIYFRCRGDTWAEDSIEEITVEPQEMELRSPPIYSSTYSPANMEDAIFADYTYDVRHYSSRTLGYQSDALKAFTGLISDFQTELMPTPFHWGLPQSRFDAALLWKAVELWEHNDWAYRPPDSQEEYQRRYSHSGRQDWEQIRSADLHSAANGFTWRSGEKPVLPTLTRRPDFPSWSWCGWKGHLGYHPRTVTQPDLHLHQSIESSISWPWNDEEKETKTKSQPNDDHDLPKKSHLLRQQEIHHDFGDWEAALKHGILTFSAWVANIDFSYVPYGAPGTATNRGAWLGWPLDEIETPLLDGVHECVLLSRQLKHPIDFQGMWFEGYRVLDPVRGAHLLNVMVVGRGEDRKMFRRGIGLLHEGVWWSFKPTWQIVRLG